jgi:hypothetical protein
MKKMTCGKCVLALADNDSCVCVWDNKYRPCSPRRRCKHNDEREKALCVQLGITPEQLQTIREGK